MQRGKGRDKKIKWKKTGGGTLRLANGKILKPNQEFYATADEIPEGFRDVVIALEDVPKEEPLKQSPSFELRADEDGQYNVINLVTDKAMNAEPLSRDEADELLEELN